MYPYRYLYDILKQLVSMGNEVHAFSGNPDGFSSHLNVGIAMKPPTEYNEMMNELVKFKYGVLIFNNEKRTEQQVNLTLTNKESEYLQAGLPSLTCWCPESETHVAKHGTGFVFNNIEEIGNCSQLEDKYMKIMDNIKIKKKELVMENYIVLLENLFAKILGLENKVIPEKIQKIHNFEFGVNL